MTKVRLTREQKAEAYRNLPIAYYESPLKQIGSKLNYYDRAEKKTVIHPVYAVAYREAKRGNRGNVLQKLARWADNLPTTAVTQTSTSSDFTEVQGA